MKKLAAITLALALISTVALAAGVCSAKHFADNFDYAASELGIRDYNWVVENLSGIDICEFYNSDGMHVVTDSGRLIAATVSMMYEGAPKNYDAWTIGAAMLAATGACSTQDALDYIDQLIPNDYFYHSMEVTDGLQVGIIAGYKYASVYLCMAKDYDKLVWQPIGGGTKYHWEPDCSNMEGPRLVPMDLAEYMGYTRCLRCF